MEPNIKKLEINGKNMRTFEYLIYIKIVGTHLLCIMEDIKFSFE